MTHRPTVEPSWIVGYEANVSPFEPLPHVHCARCGAREPFTLDAMPAVRDFIDKHRGCVLRISPENFWREVWHLAPCRGPMKRLSDRLMIEDGSELRGYECMGCGVKCFAGLDAKRYVTTRPFIVPEYAHGCFSCGQPCVCAEAPDGQPCNHSAICGQSTGQPSASKGGAC